MGEGGNLTIQLGALSMQANTADVTPLFLSKANGAARAASASPAKGRQSLKASYQGGEHYSKAVVELAVICQERRGRCECGTTSNQDSKVDGSLHAPGGYSSLIVSHPEASLTACQPDWVFRGDWLCGLKASKLTTTFCAHSTHRSADLNCTGQTSCSGRAPGFTSLGFDTC